MFYEGNWKMFGKIGNLFLNKYAWKVRMETKDMHGFEEYAKIATGAIRELLKHRFNLWDYMDELRRKNYVLELKDGTRLYLPYCRYFDNVQMSIARDDYFFDGDHLDYLKKYIIRPGMTILDIGANIGNHTVFFAKKCGASHVFSFEPQKDVYKILRKNIALNGLNGVCSTYNLALGANPGKAMITFYDRANCGGTALAMDEEGDIAVSALDEMDLPDIDFIKIDVEGFEHDVLQGGEKLLRNMCPILYIEIMDENFDKVNGLLNSYGYAMVKKMQEDYLFRKLPYR